MRALKLLLSLALMLACSSTSVASPSFPGAPMGNGQPASSGGGGGDTTYLRLDASNDPLTGDLSLTKSAPTFILTDTTSATKVGVHFMSNNATGYALAQYAGDTYSPFVLFQPAQFNLHTLGAGGILLDTYSEGGEGWGGPIVFAAGINFGQERMRLDTTGIRMSVATSGSAGTRRDAALLTSTAAVWNPGLVDIDFNVATDTADAALFIDGLSTSELVSGIDAGNSNGDVLWTIGDDFTMNASTTNGVIEMTGASFTYSASTGAIFSAGAAGLSTEELTSGTPTRWRMPSIVNTAPSKPTCGDDSEGAFLYVDDTNDAAVGQPCFCVASVDRSSFSWVNMVGAACP
jgi:hypothetical protein